MAASLPTMQSSPPGRNDGRGLRSRKLSQPDSPPMNKTVPFLLVLALTTLSFAQNAAKKSATPAAASIPATAAKVTAPLAVKDGVLSQPARTDLPDGGQAVFEFSVPNDGDYVVHAVVKAPDDDSNSFY